MFQEGEVKLEKSAITLKYAMDAERIYPLIIVYIGKCTPLFKNLMRAKRSGKIIASEAKRKI